MRAGHCAEGSFELTRLQNHVLYNLLGGIKQLV